jgi:hypothetical protein
LGAALATGCEPTPPPASNGQACSYDGYDYDECYVDQAWQDTAVRLVERRNVLILNSSITSTSSGPCLLLRNVEKVDIINVDIADCTESGIRLSNQGDAIDVEIRGGSVTNTGRVAASNGSCINAGETPGQGHTGLIIDGVTLDDCGFDDLDHAIYVQTPGYVIRNVIVGDSAGNGISVRAAGLVENTIHQGTVAPGKAHIRYFNDHPCRGDGTVRFLNNQVADAGTVGDIDISLLWSSGNTSFACERYEIVGNGTRPEVVYQVSSEFDGYTVLLQE